MSSPHLSGRSAGNNIACHGTSSAGAAPARVPRRSLDGKTDGSVLPWVVHHPNPSARDPAMPDIIYRADSPNVVAEEAVCLLNVSVHKTGTAFTKPAILFRDRRSRLGRRCATAERPLLVAGHG